MSKEKVKDKLTSYLRGKQGVKGIELASDIEVIKALGDQSFHEVMEELVEERRVVEIEYTIPSIPYRLKSFFLPEGAVIHRIRGQQEQPA
jgi:hypothetical protein